MSDFPHFDEIDRLINRTARRYARQSPGLLSDLHQEGWLCAVADRKKFACRSAGEAINYLKPRIRAAMLAYSLGNERAVRQITSRSQIKALMALRALHQSGTIGEPDIQAIARTFDLSDAEVHSIYLFICTADVDYCPKAHDVNQSPGAHSSVGSSLDQMRFVTMSAREAHERALSCALSKIDHKHATIVRSRRLEDKKVTLNELARRLGLSISGVRFLETIALQSMAPHADDYLARIA